jgi:hypothetical protein
MCALHGVRQAYSQAYHHAATGRAEVAGEQIQKRLRKLQAEEGVCWVPALPRAVQQIHDVPGQGGLSPYQILYGRERPMAGVPYEPPKVMPDAAAFFKHQREVDAKVAKVLEDLHVKRAEQVNQNRREPPPLKPGDRVWWLRPRSRTGEKLETYWIGPSVVRQRVGEHSYMVEVAEGRTIPVHRCHLKPHVQDELLGKPVKLFQYRQAVPEVDLAPDEWFVDKIINHRRDANGDWEFLVKWQDSEQSTWEPLSHFFHTYADHFIKYCHEKRLRPDVIEHLLRPPAEVAVLKRDPVTVRVVRAIQVALRDAMDPELPQQSCQIWEEPPEDCPVEWDEDGLGGNLVETRGPSCKEKPGEAQTPPNEETRHPRPSTKQVSPSTELTISVMQAENVRQFDIMSGQAAHPTPGAQGNRYPRGPLEPSVGGVVGPPGAPSSHMPLGSDQNIEFKTIIEETSLYPRVEANVQQRGDTSATSEMPPSVMQTAFNSGSKSRTRCKGSKPSWSFDDPKAELQSRADQTSHHASRARELGHDAGQACVRTDHPSARVKQRQHSETSDAGDPREACHRTYPTISSHA